MKARMLLLTVALCFAGTALTFAQSPQIGTWKLDEAQVEKARPASRRTRP